MEHGKKLLIIGGSGSLSTHMAQTALSRGMEVWTVTRGRRPLPEEVHSIIADRNDTQEFARKLHQEQTRWDAAVDCICMNASHAREDLDIVSAYTSRIAVISTDSVYDPEKKTVPQEEETEFYVMDDQYAGNKRKMELEFLKNDSGLVWTIFRPGHIYGPGFELGCCPEHARQPELLAYIRADKPLRFPGGGESLTQPIYVQDLVDCALACLDNEKTYREIFCIGGPKAVPNRLYYEILGELTGHPVRIESLSYQEFWDAHPEFRGHICQRSYSMSKLKKSGLPVPSTSLEEGLRRHVEWLDGRA